MTSQQQQHVSLDYQDRTTTTLTDFFGFLVSDRDLEEVVGAVLAYPLLRAPSDPLPRDWWELLGGAKRAATSLTESNHRAQDVSSASKRHAGNVRPAAAEDQREGSKHARGEGGPAGDKEELCIGVFLGVLMPSYRGRGLASTLLPDAMKSLAASHSARRVFLPLRPPTLRADEDFGTRINAL